MSPQTCMQIPGRERISDVDLSRRLEMPAIESQIRRARLRYAASLIKVAQPSVGALLPECWTKSTTHAKRSVARTTAQKSGDRHDLGGEETERKRRRLYGHCLPDSCRTWHPRRRGDEWCWRATNPIIFIIIVFEFI